MSTPVTLNPPEIPPPKLNGYKNPHKITSRKSFIIKYFCPNHEIVEARRVNVKKQRNGNILFESDGTVIRASVGSRNPQPVISIDTFKLENPVVEALVIGEIIRAIEKANSYQCVINGSLPRFKIPRISYFIDLLRVTRDRFLYDQEFEKWLRMLPLVLKEG
jgi:hypothetical protein